MRLSHAQMYERVLASDPDCNGRFFMGVLTTGIYCLPSCKARKPRPENIRFFPTCKAARDAGLRPCKKCHPDDFERGADPVLETIEALVNEVRAQPGAFADARAIVRRSGFGTTRAFELLRRHYHTTPADLLSQARIAAAKRSMKEGGASLAGVAAEAGFESQSAFHEQFRQFNGLAPAAWRGLARADDRLDTRPEARTFALTLPEDYPVAYLWRALNRDTHSLTERGEAGGVWRMVARLDDGAPALLTLRLPDRPTGGTVGVELSRGGVAVRAHAVVARVLGLGQDAAGFARRCKRRGLARLVAGREGLRISQTASVFDGLVWAVIGQQINFPFACLLRRRLTELAGEPFHGGEGDGAGAGLHAPPTPAAIAALEPEALQRLQFSRGKAAYLIGLARKVASGELDPEALPAMSAARVERTLLAVRGLGPWSVNYVMMRSLGFADCVPYGDTGVTSGLRALFNLDARPGVDATRRLMATLSPQRSLATAHLWQFLADAPSWPIHTGTSGDRTEAGE